MRLTQQTVMHEVRETPSPLDGQHITVNPPRFMWPDKFPHLGAVLDGVEEEDYKPEVTYRIRIARDPEFKSEVITAERKWAFFNPVSYTHLLPETGIGERRQNSCRLAQSCLLSLLRIPCRTFCEASLWRCV